MLLIAYSDDPAWSFAPSNKSEGQSKLRHLGDVVSDHELRHVGGIEFGSQDSSRCQMKVGDKKSASKQACSGRPQSPQKKRSSPFEANTTAERHREQDFESERYGSVERSAVEQILEKQQLFRRVKMRPVKTETRSQVCVFRALDAAPCSTHWGSRTATKSEPSTVSI